MYRFIPRQIPNKIFIIGCGGTGSRLIPLITQFIRSITKEHNPTGWLEKPTLYLVDFDEIEHKNLLRQNFIEQDVGKNKASVMAQRYGRAYGMNLVPILKRVDPDMTAESFLQDVPGTTGSTTFLNSMVIMCVDSAQARRNILSMVSRAVGSGGNAALSPFIIDAGNENNFGQVRFFNLRSMYDRYNDLKDIEFPKQVPTITETSWIPFDPSFYASLEDMPSQGSCADLDQTLAINAAMATSIMGVVQNFYYRKPMTYNEVCTSLDGASYTTFNTPTNFLSKVVKSDDKVKLNGFGVESMIPYLDLIYEHYERSRADEKRLKEALAKAEAEAKKAAALAAAKARKEEEEKAKRAAEKVELTDPVEVKKPTKRAKKAKVDTWIPDADSVLSELAKKENELKYTIDSLSKYGDLEVSSTQTLGTNLL